MCRTDAFLNPRIKFLISPCYHWLCDSCVSRLFSHGSAPCPHCSATLRHASFSTPTLYDHVVEKECRVRRQLRAAWGDAVKRAERAGEERERWEEWVEEQVMRIMGIADAEEAARELDDLRKRFKQTTSNSSSVCTGDTASTIVEPVLKKARQDAAVNVPPVSTLETTQTTIVPVNITRPLSTMEAMMFSIAIRHLLTI